MTSFLWMYLELWNTLAWKETSRTQPAQIGDQLTSMSLKYTICCLYAEVWKLFWKDRRFLLLGGFQSVSQISKCWNTWSWAQGIGWVKGKWNRQPWATHLSCLPLPQVLGLRQELLKRLSPHSGFNGFHPVCGSGNQSPLGLLWPTCGPLSGHPEPALSLIPASRVDVWTPFLLSKIPIPNSIPAPL